MTTINMMKSLDKTRQTSGGDRHRKGLFYLISKGDILDRLKLLIGKELTSENLHEAVFCEEKHAKIRRRFHVGTHTYVHYKVYPSPDSDQESYADITIPGNPYTYRIGLEEKEGQLIIHSEPRISFCYLT
jgi:hypothetical protein